MQNFSFPFVTVSDLMALLAGHVRRRRLERGLSRQALSDLCMVPAPSIARFEQKHEISLRSFVAIAHALGYTPQLQELMAEPIYHTMKELETINRNKNRQRGSHETN